MRSQNLGKSHPPVPQKMPESLGSLVIIGGGEDRTKDKVVLKRFVQLTRQSDPKIVVLTAASAYHDEMWGMYDRAFADLGVKHRQGIALSSREDACQPEVAEAILQADGIFMSGGDQRRLLSIIGGTSVDAAMHTAFKDRGVCVGGTSAGASAMSEHMLAEGAAKDQVTRGGVSLGAGLGFIQRAVIDQHFSERHRLSRLLTVVAQNPYLLGIGIDEDTALVIRRGHGFEVIGEGAVTLIDGRHMACNYLDTKDKELMELINVRLHLLPAGATYLDQSQKDPDLTQLDRQAESLTSRGVLASLGDIVSILTGSEFVS